MSDGSGDIIIKGGSCDLFFGNDIYLEVPGDPQRHKNKNNQKVIRVTITGDIVFDSGDQPNGLTCEVHIYTR